MPPKASANKIATAIAAVNRTVVRNVKAANRAVVKNYNAANRAINRAPAWVKWTIAAIAVAIIGYALWKVFFAGRKEGFDAGTSPFAPEGWHRYVYADIRHGTPGVVDVEYTNVGDHSISINDAKLGEFISKASTLECNAFSIYKDPSGSTLVIYKKIDSSVSGIQCDVRDDPNSVVMYVKKKDDGTELLKGVNCGYLQHKKLLITTDESSWGPSVDMYLIHNSDLDDVRSRFVSGKDRKYNVKFDTKTDSIPEKKTLVDCYRINTTGYMMWKRIDPIQLSSELPLGYCYTHQNLNSVSISIQTDKFTVYQEILPKSGAQLQQKAQDASTLNAVNNVGAAGSQKAQDASTLNAVNNVGAAGAGFNITTANTKVSETKGYEDFTGTGFDGVDFSGGATDHGSMSVEACVDKVRSGVISDMVYDKVNGKCYGKPINYDDIKDGKQKTFYNPSMYSASWHPSLKNMKISQDRFILVNKGDTLERYWMDRGWEFKAVKGWNYEDVTAWMYEATGTGKWRIINSNGSARLAVDSGKSYLKMVHAGDNGDYTHFTMEKIPDTVEEYYIKTYQGAYITTWKNANDNTTIYAAVGPSSPDPNNLSLRWIKIPYFTA